MGPTSRSTIVRSMYESVYATISTNTTYQAYPGLGHSAPAATGPDRWSLLTGRQ